MNRKKRGFALVFTIITLALATGIFFRYSMNVRSKGLKVVTEKKLSQMEDSAKQAMSSAINETYLIDQMIINEKDFNLNEKTTLFNIKNSTDYFVVKDKYYEGNGTIDIPHEKIWQVGASEKYNIENVWLRINKKNIGGKVSKLNSNYYVGGTNSFTTEKFDEEIRFSKGGYYLKSIQVVGVSKSPKQCEDKFLYFAEYSEFNNNSNKTCYLNLDATDIDNIDPIQSYLNEFVGTTEKVEFLVRLKKDIAYQVTSTDEIVAVFEGIADIKVTYNSGNKDSGKPDEIEMVNYEMNHLGP
ncbi:MAG: hypothetical protein ACRCZ2_06870 [Fusobacteriaceae bacterium]